ncbi:MAG TPA: hypothetical protein VMG11_14570 [Steroidobacteraceae bacterium]|nr:hypothetical protein [Steroidobacteraceae bacterium]
MLLAVAAFWVGLFLAVRQFPADYDWRYMTVSSLLDSGRDPAGYFFARGGIALCGLCGLVSTWLIAQRRSLGAGRRPRGAWILALGFICMACCAAFPQRLLHVPKGHEMLALAAFFALCIGMVRLAFDAAERSLRERNVMSRRRLYAALVAGLPVAPILLTGLSQAYVGHAFPHLSWTAWRERGVPIYLCFPFWQWLTCIVFTAVLASLGTAEWDTSPGVRRSATLVSARGAAADELA